MNNNKAMQWLAQRGQIPKEGFVSALSRLSKHYKKKHKIKNLNEVYQMLGTRKEYIYYWKQHPYSTQTNKKHKYRVIRAASDLFGLTPNEEEHLANQAGLSMKIDENFCAYFFQNIIDKKPYKEIYERAQVSERMFRYIKEKRIPTKETLLALMISLELKQEEMNQLLPKAGYVLSDSIVFDMVVKELMMQVETVQDYSNAIFHINHVLYDLELPLLMTRKKKELFLKKL